MFPLLSNGALDSAFPWLLCISTAVRSWPFFFIFLSSASFTLLFHSSPYFPPQYPFAFLSSVPPQLRFCRAALAPLSFAFRLVFFFGFGSGFGREPCGRAPPRLGEAKPGGRTTMAPTLPRCDVYKGARGEGRWILSVGGAFIADGLGEKMPPGTLSRPRNKLRRIRRYSGGRDICVSAFLCFFASLRYPPGGFLLR